MNFQIYCLRSHMWHCTAAKRNTCIDKKLCDKYWIILAQAVMNIKQTNESCRLVCTLASCDFAEEHPQQNLLNERYLKKAALSKQNNMFRVNHYPRNRLKKSWTEICDKIYTRATQTFQVTTSKIVMPTIWELLIKW